MGCLGSQSGQPVWPAVPAWGATSHQIDTEGKR